MYVAVLLCACPSRMNISTVADIVSIPLAGVSTIACIIALGVLLYYKMWRTFIYRLVLYSFLSLIAFSVINILLMLTQVFTEATTVDFDCSNNSCSILYVISNVSVMIASILVTCVTVCIYLMALHNYQFTYKSDLCLLVFVIFYFVIAVIVTTLWNLPQFDQYDYITVIVYVLVCLPILVNFVFTALTLVPLCCRACGYNLCMKTAATIESHRKALREILPFFILTIPSFLVTILQIAQSFDNAYIYLVFLLLLEAAGLIYSLSFAFHIFLIKKKLKRLRGKNKAHYMSMRKLHTRAAYTSEGISETCKTERLSVRESVEDERFLLKKSSQNQ